MPLARKLAMGYRRGHESLDDLVQVACVGLVAAANRFDPARGVSFGTFAVPTILGELRHHFRATGWAVHVPRRIQEVSLALKAATEEAAGRGRTLTASELAQRTSASLEEVAEAATALTATVPVSLDHPLHAGDDAAGSLGDGVGGPDDGYQYVEDWSAVEHALGALSDRERLVLRLRFEDELGQSEIADRIGVSQMHACRILRAALERMRRIAHHSAHGAPPTRAAVA